MSNKFMIHAEHHHNDAACYTSIILNNDPNLEMLVKLMATEIITDSSYNSRHQVMPPSDYEKVNTIYILPPCSQHIIHQWCNEYHYVDPQIMIQQYDCCNPELKSGDFEHC